MPARRQSSPSDTLLRRQPWGGTLKDTDGTITSIPYHNTVNIGVFSFPYMTIAAVLSDPSATESYVGLVQRDGQQLHQVRVQRHFSSKTDSEGMLSDLCVTDYFVDPRSSLIITLIDMTKPAKT